MLSYAYKLNCEENVYKYLKSVTLSFVVELSNRIDKDQVEPCMSFLAKRVMSRVLTRHFLMLNFLSFHVRLNLEQEVNDEVHEEEIL